MDLLIEKESQATRLSDFGIYNIAIEDSAPLLSVSHRAVKGRSGYIYDGATFTTKTLKVKGRVTVSDVEGVLDKQDELNALLVVDEPFYVTKMYPENSDLFNFELPGESTGDLQLIGSPHKPWKYRFKVILDDTITYEFIGKSSQGLKYNLSFTLRTAELPFGETKPKDITLSGGSFAYGGTAKASQLEWPFIIELTPSGGQTNFYIEIDGRRFEFKQNSQLQNSDKLLLTGIATTLNGNYVNAKTNYEYFIFNPNPNKRITYKTDFLGTIRILNFVELYK